MKVQRTAWLAALMASSALSTPALAQDPGAQTGAQPTTEVEEVIVTGIRRSQEQSIDIKRESTAIVDAISAEDIGKLPDVTVADALQRIADLQCLRRSEHRVDIVNQHHLRRGVEKVLQWPRHHRRPPQRVPSPSPARGARRSAHSRTAVAPRRGSGCR